MVIKTWHVQWPTLFTIQNLSATDKMFVFLGYRSLRVNTGSQPFCQCSFSPFQVPRLELLKDRTSINTSHLEAAAPKEKKVSQDGHLTVYAKINYLVYTNRCFFISSHASKQPQAILFLIHFPLAYCKATRWL